MSRALVEATISVASKYVDQHVREVGGNNHGPLVERWLKNVHLQPGDPWCVAAVWSWVDEAAQMIGEKNPLPCVGSVQKLVRACLSGPLYTKEPRRGAVFLHLKPDGKGHTGLVTWVSAGAPGWLETREGNTGPDGGRDGDGCYAKKRGLDYPNMGYLDLEAADENGTGSWVTG